MVKSESDVPDTLKGGAQIHHTKHMNERCRYPEVPADELEKTLDQKQKQSHVLSHVVTADQKVSLQQIFNDKLLSSKHILLAEDNRINQEVAQNFLIRAGASVDLANNGIEALDLLKLKTFDAILMDVQMPEMDGLETTRNIRKQEQFSNIPIIGLSAGISTQERAICIDCGMNDYVPKPIHPEQLVQTILLWTHSTMVEHSLTQTTLAKSLIDGLAANHNEQVSSFNTPVGFDMANIISMLGDIDLIYHLMKIFLEDTQYLMRDIQAALDIKDFDAAQKIIHLLIGSAGILGARSLHVAAEQLDGEIKQYTFLPETFQAFQQTFSATRTTLTQFMHPACQHPLLSQFNAYKKIQTNKIASKTILVADDNRFVQLAMQSLLSKAGARVLIASNGIQALQLVNLHHLDAVLMDIQMPEMDGLHATRHIRAQPQHQHLLIIGLSATALKKEKNACIESGMNDLIAKTVSSEQLIELLNTQLDTQ